jgi:hypothetical protein
VTTTYDPGFTDAAWVAGLLNNRLVGADGSTQKVGILGEDSIPRMMLA